MAKHAGLPESGADNPDRDFDLDVDAVDSSPPRFGRLAMWAVSATALACGVAGTVAYDVWFNQDQRAYADAMTHARQALNRSAQSTSPIASVPATEVTTIPEAMRAATSHSLPPPAQVAGLAIVPSVGTPADTATRIDTTAGTTNTLEGAPESGPGISPGTSGHQTAWTGRVATAPPPAREDPVLVAQTDPDPAPAALATAPPAVTRCSAMAALPDHRRHLKVARPTPKPTLFARMGAFFHRDSYRQHGNEGQRDLYAHS